MSPEQVVAATKLKNSEYRTYCQFISKVHCEILDPSNPDKRVGIVRLGNDAAPIYDLTDKDVAREFGTSSAIVMHNRESLHNAGLIALKQTGRGYKLVIRNSGMFNYVARKADNGYTWIYDIPEFSEYKSAPRVPETVNLTTPKGRETHENGDPGHENGESAHQNGESAHESGESGEPNSLEDKGDRSLIKGIQRRKRIKPASSLSSKSHGQEFLIWLASLGLNLLPAQQTSVKEVATRYPLPVLKRAANACLSGLTIGNSWDQCDKKLAANLEIQAEVALREDEKARHTTELLARSTAREQANAAAEIAERERQRMAEESLIEETL